MKLHKRTHSQFKGALTSQMGIILNTKIINMVMYCNTMNSEYFKIPESIIILKKVGGGGKQKRGKKEESSLQK